MFDTHCHLFKNNFPDITHVINDARDAGVKYFLIPGTNLETSKEALTTAILFENVFAGVGIHPTENLDELDFNKALSELELMAEDPKVVAIGETGLDYYRYKSSSTKQQEFLKAQINLAIKSSKALIIHNRHAGSDLLELITPLANALGGRLVFHCAEANSDLLTFALKYEFFLGVDGDITYDRKKQEFFKRAPTDRIVLETDSPYLVPEPFRSQKVFPNEPKNLKSTAETMAQIKNMHILELVNLTTRNARLLFGL